MPSVISLGAQQYYANPRNAFWRIVGELFGFDAQLPYTERVRDLLAQRVAVWDVLQSCRRVGSLDSAVQPDSLVANDFEALFVEHPSIDRVYFNGAAAEKNYTRLVGSGQPGAGLSAVTVDQPGAHHGVRGQAGGVDGDRPGVTPPACAEHGVPAACCAGARTLAGKGVRKPAGGAAPTGGRPRSRRSATTASPLRTACRRAGSTAVRRCGPDPTAPRRPAGPSR